MATWATMSEGEKYAASTLSDNFLPLSIEIFCCLHHLFDEHPSSTGGMKRYTQVGSTGSALSAVMTHFRQWILVILQ